MKRKKGNKKVIKKENREETRKKEEKGKNMSAQWAGPLAGCVVEGRNRICGYII